MKITKGELRKAIKESVSDGKVPVNEAYIAQPKSYDLPTELLSEKAKAAHVKLYNGYAKTLTNVSAHLDSVDRKAAHSGASAYRALKLDEVFNLNATWLHELYFANISDIHSEASQDSLAVMKLERDFGTFDDWQFDFMACAQSNRNGWAVTGYHMFLQRYVNFFVDGHDLHIPVGVYPVIVLDMWEHSYAKDYGSDKQTYIVGMMKEFDWAVIEQRFVKAEKIAGVLGS